MKIWTGFGSEHSYNLVLIGHFTDATRAKLTREKFDRLTQIATEQLPEQEWGDENARFTKEVRDQLSQMDIWDLSRSDLEQFGYTASVEQRGARIELTTDEGEIQGFIKLLIDAGARIEVYSAHHWTADGQPRGADAEQADREADGTPLNLEPTTDTESAAEVHDATAATEAAGDSQVAANSDEPASPSPDDRSAADTKATRTDDCTEDNSDTGDPSSGHADPDAGDSGTPDATAG